MEKIAILSEHFGSGHTRAAQSLAQGLEELDKDITTLVAETGTYSNPQFFKGVSKIYTSILKYSPKVWGYTYEHQRGKNPEKLYNSLFKIQKLLGSSYLSTLRENVKDCKTVVCTHPLPLQGMAYLKKQGWEGKLAAFITDYDFHGAWFNPAVDKYFFSGDIDPNMFAFELFNKLVLASMPIDTHFWNPINKEFAKKNLGLNEEKIVLVMGGGWGLGIDKNLVNELFKLPNTYKIIIVTGLNLKLQNKLIALVNKNNIRNVRVEGFVANIQDFMAAADILITKPGALTCSEAMALGLPTILINPIPGHEQRNCQYLSTKYATIKYLIKNQDLLNLIETLTQTNIITIDPTLASREVIKFHKAAL